MYQNAIAAEISIGDIGDVTVKELAEHQQIVHLVELIMGMDISDSYFSNGFQRLSNANQDISWDSMIENKDLFQWFRPWTADRKDADDGSSDAEDGEDTPPRKRQRSVISDTFFDTPPGSAKASAESESSEVRDYHSEGGSDTEKKNIVVI